MESQTAGPERVAPPQRFHLLLLRHAHSSWARPGLRDHDRPLDAKGEAQMRSLRDRITTELDAVRCVRCSSARRARSTLDGIREALPENVDIGFSDDLYGLGVEAYRAEALARLPDGPTLLIGHNPMIEEFAEALLGGRHEALGELRSGFGTALLASFAAPAASDGAPDLDRAELLGCLVP